MIFDDQALEEWRPNAQRIFDAFILGSYSNIGVSPWNREVSKSFVSAFIEPYTHQDWEPILGQPELKTILEHVPGHIFVIEMCRMIKAWIAENTDQREMSDKSPAKSVQVTDSLGMPSCVGLTAYLEPFKIAVIICLSQTTSFDEDAFRDTLMLDFGCCNTEAHFLASLAAAGRST
ncbi:uncharacterized protein EI90DRAFT_3073908 [Cantharellus anzutake]|uniref:uncharacterized protein n=1 Tax=Cantharellus anzutake TaxID=1750568 RepID=UPI001904C085|nr:uncharacterized protein EI90DRAFT_3077872 [Cantharellus anzutake]XP_038912048.1 uncharacterized protein EI90DRAFT_3073908 [Cantharellus anzutake]KAF8322394.1 hypothetical protein EI90DRAFT_3077872 [Cantharellus anzutake]KAF8325109.1 hypothetical protein EI90DRAFT_3073908 [Cantharellus anzutake]